MAVVCTVFKIAAMVGIILVRVDDWVWGKCLPGAFDFRILILDLKRQKQKTESRKLKEKAESRETRISRIRRNGEAVVLGAVKN